MLLILTSVHHAFLPYTSDFYVRFGLHAGRTDAEAELPPESVGYVSNGTQNERRKTY